MLGKILIADDSMTSRLFIQQALEIVGFLGRDFVHAKNGEEALEALRGDSAFDLLVTDLNMPVKNGLELIASLRSEGLHAALRIIVISSAQSALRDAELQKMGVFAVFEKPIPIARLKLSLAA